jgi:hypothetical protein
MLVVHGNERIFTLAAPYYLGRHPEGNGDRAKKRGTAWLGGACEVDSHTQSKKSPTE